jgi:hypothetical protein
VKLPAAFTSMAYNELRAVTHHLVGRDVIANKAPARPHQPNWKNPRPEPPRPSNTSLRSFPS